MTRESKLIPVLREGVDIIKMILFKEVKPLLSRSQPGLEPGEVSLLAGALLNELFGTHGRDEAFRAFSEKYQDVIQKELADLAQNLPQLRIPITDALRIQFLCDSLEGLHSEAILVRAKDHGILMEERDIPLPATFVNLAKTLGVAHGLLSPSPAESRIQ